MRLKVMAAQRTNAPLHVWMAPAWQEEMQRAAQKSLAVMCPACSFGLHRQRAVVTRQSLVEPLQLLQRSAAVVEGFGIVGLEPARGRNSPAPPQAASAPAAQGRG